MLDGLWRFLNRHIVADVPDEMAACLDCAVAQCRESKFQNCPHRIAQATALQAMRPVTEDELA